MCSKLIGDKVKRNDPARDCDVAMVGLLLLICQGAETSLRTGINTYCGFAGLALYWPHTKGKQPLIYSPACLIADQSRVWVARSVDADLESMMHRQYGPSIGSSAVVVAGRHAAAYAHDLEKTT